MSSFTPNLSLPYPALTDVPNVPSDIAALANAVDNTGLGLANTGSTPYSCTWGVVSGTAPAIGNGTFTASYIKLGRLVTVFIGLTSGTTTTYGSNSWTFSVPFTPVTTSSVHGAGTYPGSAVAVDHSGNNYGGLANLLPGSSYIIALFADTVSTSGANPWKAAGDQATSNFPLTWSGSTANQYIGITLTYESTS